MNLAPHNIIAGAGAGQVEIVERAKPVAGDCDAEFAKSLRASHEDPKGSVFVSKASAHDTAEVDLSKPEACGELIKRAHASTGTTWNPFAESQDLAKSVDIAAGNGRVVRIFKE